MLLPPGIKDGIFISIHQFPRINEGENQSVYNHNKWQNYAMVPVDMHTIDKCT